jgi:hypothetical protein
MAKQSIAPQAVEYDTDGLNGERFIILNDTHQDVPKGELEIVGSEVRTNRDSKQYPVLLLEDTDGNKFQVAAWKRDVRACILQWGGKVPDWIAGRATVRLVLNDSKSRFEISPVGNRAKTEPVT